MGIVRRRRDGLSTILDETEHVKRRARITPSRIEKKKQKKGIGYDVRRMKRVALCKTQRASYFGSREIGATRAQE